MTRPEAINRWKDIVSTVFWAEDNIAKEWYERLKAAQSLSKKEQQALADEYCLAIAENIVSKTTDEELARWE